MVSYSIGFGCILVLASLVAYLFRKPAFPKNAPPLTKEAYPVLGSLQFFTQRWDFYQRALDNNGGRNFSFYAGQWPVVALVGEEARKIFFESKALGFAEGYGALLGGSPTVQENNNPFGDSHAEESGFSSYFNKRIISMLKGNRLAEGLPQLLTDARTMLDGLSKQPTGITDPFDSIYRMVFKFTMRTVACNEIANDPALLARTLSLYEDVEATATPISIMFPWIPTFARFKRLYSGAQLYRIFQQVVDDRKKHNRRGNDALQHCIDQGDSITDIITFVLGALFAGQLNSGINSAWVLVYLAHKPMWFERVKEEINTVADRYASNKDAPLKERLVDVPCDAWEAEFPVIDMCLKDSIRLQLNGTAFRKNISGADIPLNKAGTEVIPRDAYVTLAAGNTHYSADIYENPDEWDPARYMPDRAEDKQVPYAFMGWGLGRHPCLGMRFAKLEMNLILAFFVAYFDDMQLCDEQGHPTNNLPAVDRNRHTAHKPDEQIFLKYKVREEKSAV